MADTYPDFDRLLSRLQHAKPADARIRVFLESDWAPENIRMLLGASGHVSRPSPASAPVTFQGPKTTEVTSLHLNDRLYVMVDSPIAGHLLIVNFGTDGKPVVVDSSSDGSGGRLEDAGPYLVSPDGTPSRLVPDPSSMIWHESGPITGYRECLIAIISSAKPAQLSDLDPAWATVTRGAGQPTIGAIDVEPSLEGWSPDSWEWGWWTAPVEG